MAAPTVFRIGVITFPCARCGERPECWAREWKLARGCQYTQKRDRPMGVTGGTAVGLWRAEKLENWLSQLGATAGDV